MIILPIYSKLHKLMFVGVFSKEANKLMCAKDFFN